MLVIAIDNPTSVLRVIRVILLLVIIGLGRSRQHIIHDYEIATHTMHELIGCGHTILSSPKDVFSATYVRVALSWVRWALRHDLVALALHLIFPILGTEDLRDTVTYSEKWSASTTNFHLKLFDAPAGTTCNPCIDGIVATATF